MLPEPLSELMAAYAQGDLSPERSKSAKRLLKHSAEARELLTSLRTDAKRLRRLPRHGLPGDFAAAIVNALPETRPIVLPSGATMTPRRRLLSWLVAASALMAVGMGAWLWSLPERTADPAPQLARQPKPREASNPPPAIATNSVSDVLPEPGPRADAIARETPKEDDQPKTEPGRELTAPPKVPSETIQIVAPRLPLPIDLHALTQADSRKLLADDFAKSESHRIDLFCRDSNKALDRLQAALRERGVHVISDALAQEMHKRKVRGHFLLFTDDLSASEWTALLRSLATADRKADERKAGDGVFEQLVLMPMAPLDQRDLANLLGVDPIAPFAKPKVAAGGDLRKPVSDDTADQVAQAVAAKADSAKSGRTALIVPLLPVKASPSSSREIREYLEGRNARKPGAAAVMLILRLPG